MTRDEFEATLTQARQFGGFGLDPYFGALLAHDAEQRATIKQLKERLDLVGKDFTANMAYQGQLEKRNADLMRQIATLREALEWDGLKVSDENVQWALTELGPVGTRAESYAKAVIEFAIHMRRKAQQALEEVK